MGEEKLGKYDTAQLKLTGKAGLDLAFPVVKLWVDKDTMNILKRQEYALSGRLMRTCYYPKWKKIFASPRTPTSGTRRRSASSTRWRRRTRPTS